MMIGIDHPTHNYSESPLGGTDTDKQNSSAQLACVCLSLCHLVGFIELKVRLSIRCETRILTFGNMTTRCWLITLINFRFVANYTLQAIYSQSFTLVVNFKDSKSIFYAKKLGNRFTEKSFFYKLLFLKVNKL